jgi:DnaJ-class molecular chaperone
MELNIFYLILEVNENSTKEEVHKKWIEWMKLHHSDKTGEKEEVN